MRVIIHGQTATVTREKRDTRIRGGTWGTPEAAFFGRVRDALRARGLDVIRQEMAADGHLVSEGQHYVRARDGSFCLYDGSYAVRDITEEFNQPEGAVVLLVEGRVPEKS